MHSLNGLSSFMSVLKVHCRSEPRDLHDFVGFSGSREQRTIFRLRLRPLTRKSTTSSLLVGILGLLCVWASSSDTSLALALSPPLLLSSAPEPSCYLSWLS